MSIKNGGNIDYVNILNKIKPYICILTPCYGGNCSVQYMTSLIKTIQVLNNMNIKFMVEFTQNESLISRARNNLIAKAMTNKESTHFMFIDSDISWNPIEIIKLIIRDKDLVGGIYPLKTLNFDNIKNIKNIENKSISDIKKELIKFNYNTINNANAEIKNSCLEVKHIATGFMLIKRNVIEKLQQAYPSTKYIDDIGFLNKTEEENAFALFDTSVEYDHYLSEDWLFCERWKSIGGKVYCDITISLSHSGSYSFEGKLYDKLFPDKKIETINAIENSK